MGAGHSRLRRLRKPAWFRGVRCPVASVPTPLPPLRPLRHRGSQFTLLPFLSHRQLCPQARDPSPCSLNGAATILLSLFRPNSQPLRPRPLPTEACLLDSVISARNWATGPHTPLP